MHLDYTTILKRLADSRANQALQDVKDAMFFFNDDLSHPDAKNTFTYNVGSKTNRTRKVLSKPGDISKNWRVLLSSNPLIAEEWRLRCEAADLNQPIVPANTVDT